MANIAKAQVARARHIAGRRYLTVGALVSALCAASAEAATVYDNFERPGGYTLSDYQSRWSNPYGLGEMALGDTRNFAGGAFNIAAAPFRTGADFSVYDHLKYLAVSNQTFAVPAGGGLTFSATIAAQTPGAVDGRVIHGTYQQSGLPWEAPALEGQQAAAVLNMIDFGTGQLFDIFVSGSQAFTLVERLPSSVTNPSLLPGDPGYVGLDKAYTQIVDVVGLGAGPHDVAIRYSDLGSVSFFVDGGLVSQVDNVGVPLDAQGAPFTGIYPSYGPGEPLGGQIHSFAIGHGLFSLLDAFPFQHPERPDLAVSIPLSERLFGQGAIASFDNFAVSIPEPSTWALMLAGFGLVGAALRRRGREIWRTDMPPIDSGGAASRRRLPPSIAKGFEHA
jgi:hypothetical protein